MFKKIFSFFLFSFLFLSPQAMANSYTMPDILLNYINNQRPSTTGGYTSIKNNGTSGSNTFSINYADDMESLYFNVYNGNNIVSSFGTRLIDPTGDINSNFIGLSHVPSSGNAQGGAIYNSSTIGNIIGDFIGNYASPTTTTYNNPAQGGAIYNSSTIANITSNFIGNYTATHENASGGAIYNGSTIGNIRGDFIGNYTTPNSTIASGGAIYNASTIGNITSNFIGNYTSGRFALGGAIYNYSSTIANITGNFIGNYTTATTDISFGGAIYNYGSTATISFLADNRTSYFTDNYTLANGTKNYNAIHNSGTLTFNMQGTGSFVMNDSITGSGGTIYINGDSANNNIFYLNDSITGNEVTLSNATLKLGYYTHDDGTITSGYSSDTTATINFTNNSFLDLNLIDFDFTADNSILSNATLDFGYSKAVLRNANLGAYTLGNTQDLTNIVSSASSLHTLTIKNNNEFDLTFNQDSTLISNSQLGEFMTQIGNSLSAQSDISANRFIFQASQVGTDTKKQAAIVDGTAQLNAMGASHALARSAISAKQGSINTRISQSLAYNVENFIASNADIDGINIENPKNISLWLMPHYTHERVSGMDSGSFAHAYTSHLFGFTFGADKAFYKDYSSYSLGLALDAGLGASNARGDIENIKNNFNNYGATAYGSLNKNNFIFSTNLGYERGNNDISLNMEAYDALENQYADITSNALFASVKAEYNIDMLYFYHSKEEKKKEAAQVAKLQAEQEAQKAEENAMRENAEDPDNLIDNLAEPTIYEEIPDYEMPSFFAMLYGETHRKNAKYTVKEDYDRTMSFLLVPYIALDFMTINSGEYEVYSYNTSNKTDTTFNVESERQNVFTIPLGVQIKPELAEMNGLKVSPQVKLGLAHSFGDLAEKSTTTAKGLTSTAYLETENIDALRGDFGISANIINNTNPKLENMNFDLSYDLEVSKNRFSHSLFAKASYEF